MVISAAAHAVGAARAAKRDLGRKKPSASANLQVRSHDSGREHFAQRKLTVPNSAWIVCATRRRHNEFLLRFGASLPKQDVVREYYEKQFIQIVVAGLIFGNFIVSALQAQLLPEKEEPLGYVFFAFEIIFNGAFTIELLANMYGNYLLRFWRSAWNIFDFVIVVISLLAIVLEDLPGISVLRLFRAFRVFRLFKRIKSLRLIIVGVLASLPGVCHAFVVLTLIMSIWSIMGVNFFGDDPDYDRYYGDFSKAMLSQFQIMTLDSWASEIARPIIFEKNSVYALFFVSYIFINAIMMMNVVVAILLDKFVKAIDTLEKEDALRRSLPKCVVDGSLNASADDGGAGDGSDGAEPSEEGDEVSSEKGGGGDGRDGEGGDEAAGEDPGNPQGGDDIDERAVPKCAAALADESVSLASHGGALGRSFSEDLYVDVGWNEDCGHILRRLDRLGGIADRILSCFEAECRGAGSDHVDSNIVVTRARSLS